MYGVVVWWELGSGGITSTSKNYGGGRVLQDAGCWVKAFSNTNDSFSQPMTRAMVKVGQLLN